MALAKPPPPCWPGPDGLDRSTTPGRYVAGPAKVSDVMLGVSFAMAVAVPVWLDVEDSLSGTFEWRSTASMLGAGIVGLAPPMVAKRTVCRERPFRLDPAGTHDQGDDNYASFFSGHTASAGFASFGAVSDVYYARERDLNVLYVGYPLAVVWTGTMGAMRVAAGEHYLSDVLLGGLSGAAAGVLVPLAIDQTRAPAQRTTTPIVLEFGGRW